MTQAFNLAQFANTLNSSGQTSLTSGVTGTLPIANGGTGNVTANAAINALLPSQTGNTNKYLRTDGTDTSWVTPPVFGGAQIQTSSSDIILTSSSNQLQLINITTVNKRIILPATTAISSLAGSVFYIVNTGEFAIDVATTNGYRIAQITPSAGVNIGLSANTVADEGWVIDGRPVEYGIGESAFASTTLTIENVAASSSVVSFNEYVSVTPLTSTTFMMAWIDNATNDVYGIVGTISGSTITYGTATLLYAGTLGQIILRCCSATSWLLVTTTTSWDTIYRAGTLSGSTISVNGTQPANSGNVIIQDLIVLNSTQFFFAYRGSGTDGVIGVRAITHNGSSVATVGTGVTLATGGLLQSNAAKIVSITLIDTLKIGVFYAGFAVGADAVGSLNARIATVSGTTTTLGTALSLPAPYNTYLGNPIGRYFYAQTISTSQYCAFAGSPFAFTFNVSGTGVTLANATGIYPASQQYPASQVSQNLSGGYFAMAPFFNGNSIGMDGSGQNQIPFVAVVNILPDTGFAVSNQVISTATTPSNGQVTLMDSTTAVIFGFNSVQSGQPWTNYPTAAVIKAL
jgi:hypothetical protein